MKPRPLRVGQMTASTAQENPLPSFSHRTRHPSMPSQTTKARKRKGGPIDGTEPGDKRRRTADGAAKVSSTRNGTVTLEEIEDEDAPAQQIPDSQKQASKPNPWLTMTPEELNVVRGEFMRSHTATTSSPSYQTSSWQSMMQRYTPCTTSRRSS